MNVFIADLEINKEPIPENANPEIKRYRVPKKEYAIMIIDITKAFNSYLSYGVFNYRIENNNIYVNDLLIEAQGRPRINQRNLDIFK